MGGIAMATDPVDPVEQAAVYGSAVLAQSYCAIIIEKALAFVQRDVLPVMPGRSADETANLAFGEAGPARYRWGRKTA